MVELYKLINYDINSQDNLCNITLLEELTNKAIAIPYLKFFVVVTIFWER